MSSFALASTSIVATTGNYSRVFVPAIAKQIKNGKIVVTSLIVGSVGYAVGTFLGIGVAALFGLLLG